MLKPGLKYGITEHGKEDYCKRCPPVSQFLLFRHEGGLLVLPPFRLWPSPNERKREVSENSFWFISCFESRQSICYAWSQACVSRHVTGRARGFGETTCWCTTELYVPFDNVKENIVFCVTNRHHSSGKCLFMAANRPRSGNWNLFSLWSHTQNSVTSFSDETLQVIKTHLSQEGLSIPASL